MSESVTVTGITTLTFAGNPVYRVSYSDGTSALAVVRLDEALGSTGVVRIQP